MSVSRGTDDGLQSAHGRKYWRLGIAILILILAVCICPTLLKWLETYGVAQGWSISGPAITSTPVAVAVTLVATIVLLCFTAVVLGGLLELVSAIWRWSSSFGAG